MKIERQNWTILIKKIITFFVGITPTLGQVRFM